MDDVIRTFVLAHAEDLPDHSDLVTLTNFHPLLRFFSEQRQRIDDKHRNIYCYLLQ